MKPRFAEIRKVLVPALLIGAGLALAGCETTGNTLVEHTAVDGIYRFVIRKA